MNVSKKLVGFFLMIILIGAVLGIFSSSSIYRVIQSFNATVDNVAPKLILLGKIRGYSERIQVEALSIVLIRLESVSKEISEEEAEEFEEFEMYSVNLDEAIDRLDNLKEENDIERIEKNEFVKNIRASKNMLYNVATEMITATRENKSNTVILNLKEKLEDAEEDFDSLINAGIVDEVAELDIRSAEANELVNNTTLLLFIISLSEIIMAIILGIMIFRSAKKSV